MSSLEKVELFFQNGFNIPDFMILEEISNGIFDTSDIVFHAKILTYVSLEFLYMPLVIIVRWNFGPMAWRKGLIFL